MTFAEKLKSLRLAKGLTEVQLAEACGETFAAMHAYCVGARKPSFAKVVRIAAALDASCEDFADCDDVKPTKRKGRK